MTFDDTTCSGSLDSRCEGPQLENYSKYFSAQRRLWSHSISFGNLTMSNPEYDYLFKVRAWYDD